MGKNKLDTKVYEAELTRLQAELARFVALAGAEFLHGEFGLAFDLRPEGQQLSLPRARRGSGNRHGGTFQNERPPPWPGAAVRRGIGRGRRRDTKRGELTVPVLYAPFRSSI